MKKIDSIFILKINPVLKGNIEKINKLENTLSKKNKGLETIILFKKIY